MTQKRNIYYDFIRGIAIIMVVGIHTFAPMSKDVFSVSGVIGNIVRQLLNCAVPIFLAISGYFLSNKISLKTNKREQALKIKKQILKVYIPALVFSLPYLMCSLLYVDSFRSVIISFFMFFICGYGVFYFILLIIQYYLLTPILLKHYSAKLLVGSSIMSALSILVVTYLLQVLSLNIPLIFYAGPCTLWGVFFCLGIYIRRCNQNYSFKLACYIAVIGLIMSVLESYFWSNNGIPLYGIKLSSFIYSTGVILLLFSSKVSHAFRLNSITNIITRIGGISFGIYLAHLSVIGILGLCIQSDIWAVRWILTLATTAVIIIFLNRCIPDRYHRLLGLA